MDVKIVDVPSASLYVRSLAAGLSKKQPLSAASRVESFFDWGEQTASDSNLGNRGARLLGLGPRRRVAASAGGHCLVRG